MANTSQPRSWPMAVARTLPVRPALGVDAGMTRLTRLCRAVGVGLAVATATLSMTQVANAAPAPPTLPGRENIAAPAGQQGVPGRPRHGRADLQVRRQWPWTFVAPRADLVDDNGKLIVKHSAGPTWQATDGSSVKGAVAEREVDPDCGPRFRGCCSRPPASAGRDGDRLARTTFIQRVNTDGGLAPDGPLQRGRRRAGEEVPTGPTTSSRRRPAPDRAHRPAEWPLPDRSGSGHSRHVGEPSVDG